jgi:pentatricopeptide repeat protein
MQQAGDWRKALALLDEMGLDSLPPDVYSYRAAIAALANVSGAAMHSLMEVGQKSLLACAIAAIATVSIAVSGLVGSPPDACSYRAAIAALANANAT